MIHLTLDPTDYRPLPFYLAMEEWAATRLPAAEYFFTWIVDPTVIIGRNQDINTEVNRAYCTDHGIKVYRRKSGGGCVFADRNNMMMSYITPSTDVETTFRGYTRRVAASLCALGFDAEATGRNDVAVAGGKVSGNAFYHLPGRSIAHGTMLFDSDMTHIRHAITPSRAKLESKGVKSVESRITTLRHHRPELSMDEFRRSLIVGIVDSEIRLTDADIAEIEKIAEDYFRPEWIETGGHSSKRRGVAPQSDVKTIRSTTYIDGVGCVTMSVDIDADGYVKDIHATGDYMIDDAIVESFSDYVSQMRLTPEALDEVLLGLPEYISKYESK